MYDQQLHDNAARFHGVCVTLCSARQWTGIFNVWCYNSGMTRGFDKRTRHKIDISGVLYSTNNEIHIYIYIFFPLIPSICAFKLISELSLFSSKRSMQLPHSLKSWLCGPLMKQSSFLLSKLKLRHTPPPPHKKTTKTTTKNKKKKTNK